ncbi:somatostatin receptor type 1 [Plakobranchus ocellatus]|uniref:Somatostatin receptor type 1 n=1 Tax=Plakobranchus ocellatus TaxID=259542 RepID=A0AAV3YV58_9GAST|nr:somatostatin receptor type 1 [Plakobranchus ocellatus]
MSRTDFVEGPLNGSKQPVVEISTAMLDCNNTYSIGNRSRYNETDESTGMEVMTYICVVCYLLICVLGLVGNGLVIYVVLMYAKMKTVTNMYILNLALSDFFFLIILPFLATTTLIRHWSFGFAMCKIYFVVYSINLFGGVFNLLLMSADRYLAVCHPIRSVKYRTPRIALFICLCVWSVSFLVMLPVILYSTTMPHPYLEGKVGCAIVWPDNQLIKPGTAFIWYSFILGFAVPVSLISVFYLLVILRLRHVGPVKKSEEKKKSHRRVTRLVLTVIAVYVLCWLPHWCFQVNNVFMAEDENTSQTEMEIMMYVMHSFTILCYANSMLNPFLYAFLSENFRQSFSKAFKCLPFSLGTNKTRSGENSVFPRTSQTGVGRTGVSQVCEEKLEMTPFTAKNPNQSAEDREQPEFIHVNNRKANDNEEEEEGEGEQHMLDRNGDENTEFLNKPVHL